MIMKRKNLTILCTAIIAIITSSNIYSASAAQQETNKQNVLEFYDKALNQKDFSAAEKYLGSTYTQHNPSAADGVDGLRKFIEFLRINYPNSHSDIIRVFTDNDYVILHVHSIREPGTRGRAIFDLFKLENGKIIEHWDTTQDIPETSANSNGMF